MNNFQIEQEIQIESPAKEVFEHMTNDVSTWWSHSFTETPKRIVLEPKLGGHFFEEFESGGSALYATVTYIEPNKKLVLQGPMGKSGAIVGSIAFELNEGAGGTLLKLSHHAFGEVTDEQKQNYSKGWQELLGNRLKSVVEKGGQ